MSGFSCRFQINAPGHPFWIKTIQGNTTANDYTNGVSGNGTQVGTVSFTVSTNAPALLFYNCQFHAAMTSQLHIDDPPSIRIASFAMSTHGVFTSTWGYGLALAPVPSRVMEYRAQGKRSGESGNTPFSDFRFRCMISRKRKGIRNLRTSMKEYAGVWIDHGKAVVVLVTDGDQKTVVIKSGFQKHVRSEGRTQNEKGAHSPEDRRDRRFTGQLDRYYDQVISLIQAADCTLLFGPGEAKGELRKRLERTDRSGHTVVVKTDDKMTDRQIVAKVRREFTRSGDTSGSSARDADVNRSILKATRSKGMKVKVGGMRKTVGGMTKMGKPTIPEARAEQRPGGTQIQHFQVKAPPGSEVFLVGSFNGWNVTANRMRQNGQELYVADIELPPGHHEYKFLVDGQWLMDHERTAWAPNPFGSLNSVLELAESGR